MIAFGMRLSPLQVGLVVGGTHLAGVLINVCGLYVIPGLVVLGTLYSYIAGYGIFFVAVIIAGLALGGWQSALAFFLAKLAAIVVAQVIDFWQISRYHKLTGHVFTGSEVSFFNAYRLHASRIGATTDIDLSDVELEEDHWGETFTLFAMQWPEVVRRFTAD
ncbi:MAG: hypothetical protein WC058_02515 [Phycisphaeraceae bacterium]